LRRLSCSAVLLAAGLASCFTCSCLWTIIAPYARLSYSLPYHISPLTNAKHLVMLSYVIPILSSVLGLALSVISALFTTQVIMEVHWLFSRKV
jgi:hypothetical protein